MSEMSKNFQIAHGLSHLNPSEAIALYTKEVELIDPSNHAAYFNRGLCKLSIAEKEFDQSLIESARKDILQANEMANSEYGHGYEGAEINLKWADEIEEKIKRKETE